MPVDFEGLTDKLFGLCDQYLGDTVTITPPSGPAIVLKLNATHRDRRADFGLSSATVQDAMLDVDMHKLPGRPGKGWRVSLPRIPGRIFEPLDVERDDSGLRWEFALKGVTNG
jgi:hypothetical protein